MDSYELEQRRLDRIAALPWWRRLGRWWGIVWLPFTVIWVGFGAMLGGYLWWVL